MKLLKLLAIAAAVLFSLGSAHAEESSSPSPSATPAPAYSYPPCYQDPDVTCMSQPGDPESHPSYESGQYPDGWYDARYTNDKPNDYRKAELYGQGYGAYGYKPAPTPTPVQAEVQHTVQEAIAPITGPVITQPVPKTPDQEFLDMIQDLLNRDF